MFPSISATQLFCAVKAQLFLRVDYRTVPCGVTRPLLLRVTYSTDRTHKIRDDDVCTVLFFLPFSSYSVNLASMLMIRLQRTGRKHEPTFRVVLTDSKNGPKSGKYLKNLGWYDTRLKNDAAKQLDVEQVKHWMSKGAKLSLTLHNFLISQKVIEGKKLNALPKKTVQKKKEEAVAEAPKVEVKKEEVTEPAAETAPAEAKKEAVGESASKQAPVEVKKEESIPSPTVQLPFICKGDTFQTT